MTLTIADVLSAATGRLRAAGISGPRREARLLAQLAFNMSAASMISAEKDAAPTGEPMVRYTRLLNRRTQREPFQHIAGRVDFYGIELLSDSRALVPRADSEVVVDAALERLPETSKGLVADLGSGSGCLLLAVLSQRPDMRGVGVDASLDACALAKANLVHTGLIERGGILHARWEDWDGWPQADLVLSNPPYIASEVIDTLEPEVRLHDPREALDGGQDGLAAYRSILTCASQMKPSAWLVLEIGFDQAESVTQLARDAGFERVALTADLGENDRALTLRKASRE